jgi:hypothetical protein
LRSKFQKSRKIEIMKSIYFYHNMIETESRNRKTFEKPLPVLKFSSGILNSPWVKEGSIRRSEKYFETE